MTQKRIPSLASHYVATIALCAATLTLSSCRKHEAPNDPATSASQGAAELTPATTASGTSSSPQPPNAELASSSAAPSDSGSGFAPPTSAPTTPQAIAAEYANRPAALQPMSLAEFQYGVSPTRNSDVTYQPDVVVMEHGAEAIHGYSSDGLTWLLDANAPHVAELQPGKIMFASSRAVGRILGVTPHGSDIAVTLGPAALNEVVSDLQMSFDQPVDLSSAILYMAPNSPLHGDLAPLVKDTTKTSDAQTDYGDEVVSNSIPNRRWQTPIRPVVFTHGIAIPARLSPRVASTVAATTAGPLDQVFNLVGPMVGLPQPVNVSGFKVSPYQGGGLGITIARNNPELMMVANGAVKLDRPSLRVNLNISHGNIQTAELELKGAAALLADIQAGTQIGLKGNINRVYYVPTDLSIPIFGKAVPFAVTFHQSFIVETAFTAKNSTLNAGGEEDFTGSVFMGYHGGSWGVGAPTSMTNKRDLLQSINGVSLGASSIIFGWGTKMIVGIGAFGFATGPYLGYNTTVAVVRGSDLTTGLVPVPPCHGAVLSVGLNAGVGYTLPAPFVSAVNSMLNLLHLNAQLPPTGGVGHQENVIRKEKSVPDKCASF